MNWIDLRLLLTLLTEGSLKGAARTLGQDYTTVWRHVQRLEERLGARVFVRLHGRIQLTSIGRELAERAREIERLIVSAQALGTGTQRAMGQLRVGTADMLLGPIVLPVFRTLKREAPELTLSLEVSPLVRNVAQLEVDAAIRLGQAAGESVVEVALGQLGFGAYAAPSMSQAWQGRDVRRWPLLTLHKRWSDFPTSRWLASHAPAARSVGEFDTMMSMAEATEAGLGVGLLPHAVAARSGRLVLMPLPSPIETARLTMVYHPDMRNDGRIRALVAAARFEAKERRDLLLHGIGGSGLGRAHRSARERRQKRG
jgi:DNA-binding transcriptional LysR family regulator